MTISNLRDISLILLAIEALLIGAIYGLIFFFIWKSFRIATKWLRGQGLPRAQKYAALAKEGSQQYSKKVAGPVVQLETRLTQVSRTMEEIAAFTKQRNRS